MTSALRYPSLAAAAVSALLLSGCEFVPFYGATSAEEERDRLVAVGFQQVAADTAEGAAYVLEYSGDPANKVECRPRGHNRYIPLRQNTVTDGGTSFEYRTDIRISLTREEGLLADGVRSSGLYTVAALRRPAGAAQPDQIELIHFPADGDAAFKSRMTCQAM